MSEFLAFTVIGIVAGSTYAIAASGLVLTYATSNVFNIAHGAVGMVGGRVTAVGEPEDIRDELSAAYLGGAA